MSGERCSRRHIPLDDLCSEPFFIGQRRYNAKGGRVLPQGWQLHRMPFEIDQVLVQGIVEGSLVVTGDREVQVVEKVCIAQERDHSVPARHRRDADDVFAFTH